MSPASLAFSSQHMHCAGLTEHRKGTIMFGIGTTELIIIMFIILLIFGAKKLPELAQGLGKGIREFKRASNEIQDELKIDQEPVPPQQKKKSETPKDSADKT
jgi:TatA/E family protein of Tat protein translocase